MSIHMNVEVFYMYFSFILNLYFQFDILVLHTNFDAIIAIIGILISNYFNPYNNYYGTGCESSSSKIMHVLCRSRMHIMVDI